MNPKECYLRAVIARHRAEAEAEFPRRVRRQIEPLLRSWGGTGVESVFVSGSYPKATAPRDSDVDLFVSLSPDTAGPLAEIHASLAAHFQNYLPEVRNVSVRILFEGARVDLVPGRRREGSRAHTLWQSRYDTGYGRTWRNRFVTAVGLLNEILALKNMAAKERSSLPLVRVGTGGDSGAFRERPHYRVLCRAARFLASEFPKVRLVDPANSNNVISDALTLEEKLRVAAMAEESLSAQSVD